MEARRLRPLIQPHCPRRNQCSPVGSGGRSAALEKAKSTDRENRQVLAALIIHFIGKIFATKR